MKHRQPPVPPPLWFSLLIGALGLLMAGASGWAFTSAHLWWSGVFAVLAIALWATAVYFFPTRPREEPQDT